MKISREHVILIGILLLALALRLWGIGFGLPFRYHVDEQGYVPHAALLCSGKFDMPPWTHGPNLFHIVLCSGDIALYIAGLVIGIWHSPQSFQAFYDVDPTWVYLMGRSISALAGTATIVAVFLLGRQLWDRSVGLLAAVLLAFTFLHVRDSHYAVPDVFMVLLLTMAAYFSVKEWRQGGWRGFALAGVMAGLATGVKFTAGLISVMVLVTLIMHAKSRQVTHQRRIALGLYRAMIVLGLAFILGFVIGYPNIAKVLFAPTRLLDDVFFEWHHVNDVLATIRVDTVPGWLFYPKALWWGMGPSLMIVAMLGVGYALWRHSSQDILLLSFVVPYYVLIGGAPWYTAHYAIPLLPFLCLFAARLLSDGVRKFPGGVRSRVLASAILVPLILLPSVVSIVRYDYLLGQEDTRTLAKRWIEANIPAGYKIGIPLYVFWVPPLSSLNDPQPYSARTYDLVTLGYDMAEHSLKEYRREGFDYLIASSYVYNLPWRDQAKEARKRAFYAALDSQAELVQEFRPYHGGTAPPFIHDQVYGPTTSLFRFDRPGPTIKIYRVKR